MTSLGSTFPSSMLLGQFVALLLALPLLHCGNSGRHEAAVVLRALEDVREAAKEQKGPAALALAKTACSNSVVCATRDQCASVYQHFANGIAAQNRVHEELEILERTPPASAENLARLTEELARAQTEVDTAQTGLAECERAASLMRRTFGI